MTAYTFKSTVFDDGETFTSMKASPAEYAESQLMDAILAINFEAARVLGDAVDTDSDVVLGCFVTLINQNRKPTNMSRLSDLTNRYVNAKLDFKAGRICAADLDKATEDLDRALAEHRDNLDAEAANYVKES